MDRIFFVYVDWTLENVPRTFYVGKGNKDRIQKRERNAYWKSIAAKYGWRRDVILATKDEQFALEQEIVTIREFKTYHYDRNDGWGCNFTRDGEGTSGHPRTPKQLASLAIRNSTHEGQLITAKMIQAAADAKRGKPGHRLGKTNEGARRWCASEDGKKSIIKAIAASADSRRGKPACNRGKLHSEETKQKIREARKGQPGHIPSDAHRQKLREKALEREARRRNERQITLLKATNLISNFIAESSSDDNNFQDPSFTNEVISRSTC
jgi:hypothetical protein